MNHFIFYRGSSNWYMRLVHVADGKVWDKAAIALGAATAWTDSAILLSFDTVIGGHKIILPASLPAGEYDVLFYDNASPAVTDEVAVGKRLSWHGNGLNRLPVVL